jgi:hypothetical protein
VKQRGGALGSERQQTDETEQKIKRRKKNKKTTVVDDRTGGSVKGRIVTVGHTLWVLNLIELGLP